MMRIMKTIGLSLLLGAAMTAHVYAQAVPSFNAPASVDSLPVAAYVPGGAAPAAPVAPPAAPAPAAARPFAAPSAPHLTVPPAAPSASANTSVGQFEAWLQNNGLTSTPPANVPAPRSAPSRSTHAAKHQSSRPLTFEESQQVMLQSAPPARVAQDPNAAAAFNMMMQQNMPLSPQQIVQLRQQIDTSQRAAAIPALVPPKPVSSTLMINLAPGTTPPAVRLAQGYVTSLLFVDSTGAPWSIAAFDVGNPKAVNIQWDGKSNILLIQAVLPYSDGDIVVRLVGLPTPVTLTLVAGQRVVDYRVDAHISGIGPNAKEIPMGSSLPNSANQLLLNILDGIPPAGASNLTVQGADAQAWLLGDRMFLRTRLTLLSPGWVGTMVSPDGMHAYELFKTSSVLVSRYGEPVELRIEGF